MGLTSKTTDAQPKTQNQLSWTFFKKCFFQAFFWPDYTFVLYQLVFLLHYLHIVAWLGCIAGSREVTGVAWCSSQSTR